MFEDRRCSVEEIAKATATAREWIQSQVKGPNKPNRPPLQPAQVTEAIVRCDAAWHKGKQIAGLGWTIDDTNGAFSFATTNLNVRSPLLAEGLAMRAATTKCKDLGISQVQCQSDSVSLIKVLKAEVSNAELYGIAADIFSLSSSFECISFLWIPRERNQVTDGLAKRVLADELAINAPTNSV